MDTERVEARVAEAVEAVRPEFSPALQQRAMAAIAAAAPAPARSRRWAVVVVGAAAILVGLGFVPLPAGRTHGVLARAMATLDAGPNIHVVARGWSGDDEYRFEEWSAADGSMRYEAWKNGTLSHLHLDSPDRSLMYTADTAEAWEDDLPPMPGRLQILTKDSTRAGFESTLQFLGDAHHDVTVSERRERSLWGGEVDVIEAERHVSPGVVLSGVPYGEVGTTVMRAEVDPQTNRVLSLREYLKTEEGQRLVFETEAIEWDAEIPASVWEFEPPAGTKVNRSSWWATRAGKELAAADSGDWRVVLHAIDVNRTGDVALTLSRWLPEGEEDIRRRPETPYVQATDDQGSTYSQDPGFGCDESLSGGYWITTLRPAKPAPVAGAITLTIGSTEEADQGHPPVTFANLPLPPRQKVDDLFAAAKEVVQY